MTTKSKTTNNKDRDSDLSAASGSIHRTERATSIGFDLTDNWWKWQIAVFVVVWILEGAQLANIGQTFCGAVFVNTLVCGRITTWRHLQSNAAVYHG
jgi:hypothetical protein